MSAHATEQIVTHLEFLGYEITHKSELAIAKHPHKFNLFMRPLAGGFLFKVYFGCNDHAKQERLDYLDQINSLNNKAAVARFLSDKDSDFCIEAWHSACYDRTEFGAFMELWWRDCDLLAKSEIDRYIK